MRGEDGERARRSEAWSPGWSTRTTASYSQMSWLRRRLSKTGIEWVEWVDGNASKDFDGCDDHATMGTVSENAKANGMSEAKRTTRPAIVASDFEC